MSKRSDAVEFVRRWRGILAKVPASQNNEQQDTQKFWNDLLENVLGVPGTTLPSYVDYERRVRGRRIDVFIEDHHFLCEQKSVGIDLDKPEVRQRHLETPLQQAVWYAQNLPYSVRPRWVMTCNSILAVAYQGILLNIWRTLSRRLFGRRGWMTG
jgi:hypothetical protein